MVGLVTFVGVAHSWMCDAMDHMNVRHYAAMLDDASFQLLGLVAKDDPLEGSKLGWADRRIETDFQHEVSAGTLITIRSQVEEIGRSSIVYHHQMTGSLDGIVRAACRVVTVRFDLQTRSKVDLSDNLRANAQALMAGLR